MNPAIKITPFECLRVSIPVEDYETRLSLAKDMLELVDAHYLLRVYTITGAVICEASNKADADGAALFAEAWLKARRSLKAAA